MNNSIEITRAGIQVAMLGLPKYGLQKWGVSPGGPMDLDMAKSANVMVGNTENTPVIEGSFLGFDFHCHSKVLISVCGIQLTFKVNDVEYSDHQTIALLPGDRVQIKNTGSGNWIYVAFSGRLIFSSEFSNIQTISKGDIINYLPDYYSVPLRSLISDKNFDRPIRLLRGPESHILSESEWELLCHQPYCITSESNRMALKLSSKATLPGRVSDISSSGLVDGTIQLLSNGQLLILMRDRQTTGGYARIGVIHDDDISRLSQQAINHPFYFELFHLSNH